MNTILLTANALLLITLLVHAIMGDRDLKAIEPDANDDQGKQREAWTLSRCTFHWVTLDLLLATSALTLINFTSYIRQPQTVLQFLATYLAAAPHSSLPPSPCHDHSAKITCASANEYCYSSSPD